MNLPANLRSAVNNFNEQLNQRQQTRRQERATKRREGLVIQPSPTHTSLSLDVAIFFRHILTQIENDRSRYFPEKRPAPYTEGHAPPANFSPYVKALWDKWAPLEAVTPPPALPVTEEPVEPMPLSAHQACVDLLMGILSPLLDDTITTRQPVPASLIIKLRQAVQSFAENRIKDAATLLRNAAHGDPHNPHILVMLSQITYYMAATESPNTLPEARELAQKSMVPNDRITPETLSVYRYLALVTERAFSAEKVLEWVRLHSMLDPTVFTDPEGLFVAKAFPLRTWAIMATIPAELWTEADMEALTRLTVNIIGGGAMFLAWFKPLLQSRHPLSKTPLSGFGETDKLVQTAQAFHTEIAAALRQMPTPASEFPWLIRVRYLQTLVKVAPVPTFDQTLCHVALNAQSCNETGFPNTELRALLQDYSLVYWNLWAMSITPADDTRLPYLIPADETQMDGDLLAHCDTLLKTLREQEKQRIKPHLWDDLKPWMARWQLDHLLAAATGSNKPRSRFAPNLIPYTHFYRQWQNPAIQGYMASDIIQETARRGGFASLFEVVAAFDGAIRMMDDPVHGIVAAQKRALTAAHQANPRRFKSVSAEFGFSKGASLMGFLLPLGGVGLIGAVISFSSNWGQAAGLILALLGVGGVIMLNLTRGD